MLTNIKCVQLNISDIRLIMFCPSFYLHNMALEPKWYKIPHVRYVARIVQHYLYSRLPLAQHFFCSLAPVRRRTLCLHQVDLNKQPSDTMSSKALTGKPQDNLSSKMTSIAKNRQINCWCSYREGQRRREGTGERHKMSFYSIILNLNLSSVLSQLF